MPAARDNQHAHYAFAHSICTNGPSLSPNVTGNSEGAPLPLTQNGHNLNGPKKQRIRRDIGTLMNDQDDWDNLG